MKLEKMNQIFLDTAFVHAGGSDEELQVAQYFQKECAQLGLEAIETSLMAGAIGFVIVMILMIAIYFISGLASSGTISGYI